MPRPLISPATMPRPLISPATMPGPTSSPSLFASMSHPHVSPCRCTTTLTQPCLYATPFWHASFPALLLCHAHSLPCQFSMPSLWQFPTPSSSPPLFTLCHSLSAATSICMSLSTLTTPSATPRLPMYCTSSHA
ncbi:hypothetical protein Pmani_004215 [Petrolisthes manimaculis]|uniref:Uncharacterized protein n=1 Tax=Petrolisthes manimaculis TaxID=1843537 RepID=A0AAE1UP74_9EUCA|nr:hypothetical protein Pmani_004215 [Petrolisthes manimaculis]